MKILTNILYIFMLLFSPIVVKRIRIKYANTDYYRFYIFSIITTLVLLFLTLNHLSHKIKYNKSTKYRH